MSAYYQIEQAVAQRCGPFLSDVIADSGAAWASNLSVNALILPTQISSLDLGDNWTGSYILRRGLLQNASGNVAVMPTSTPPGNLGPYFPTGPLASDRIRRVASVDYGTGTFTPDRPWTNYPASQELIELHYLDPARELKVAATAGLDRCFTVDRSQVTLASMAAKRDLTALAPWITTKNQVQMIQWNYTGSFAPDVDVQWWDAFMSGGHVWLSVSPDPFPNSIVVTSRRSMLSLVTGGQIGPTTGASIAFGTPATVSLLNHGLTTGMVVTVTDSLTANGTWVVTVLDENTFTLDGSSTTASVSFTATVSRTVPPYVDLDDFPVTLDYAAAAGHVAAWMRFADRLAGAAQASLRATLAQAAAELTKQAIANYQPTPKDAQFDSPFPSLTGVNRI